MQWRIVLIGFLVITSVFPALAGRTKLTDEQRAWMDQVDPIMTNDERKEFKRKLHTERERQQFMELFWAKRDPDLTDNVNPFKREYLARLDYVLARFEGVKSGTPQTAMGRIFLLLGKPTKEETRIDYSITGVRYRNPFPGRPALLWVYEAPGYDFPRDEIRIQFVPTTVFGDYNALSDQLTWHHLRTIKFKFIVNPDLDEAPLLETSSQDFQDGTGITGVDVSVPALDANPAKIERRLPDAPMPKDTVKEEAMAESPPQKIERRLPETAMPEDTVKEEAIAESPPQKIERRLPDATMPKDTVKEEAIAELPPQKIERRLPETAMPEDAVKEEAIADTPPQKIERRLPEPQDKQPIEQVALNVPGVTSEVGKREAPVPAAGFDEEAGNELQLAGAMATFKRDRDRSMVLGRLGFPLRSLDFDYHSNVSQYAAPMNLKYTLENQAGKTVLSDTVVREVLLNDVGILKRRNPFFTKEFAAILPPGRYTLKMELLNQRTKKRAYSEQEIDVANYQSGEVDLTPLRFLTPDVNPDEAKFRIDSQAMSLKLEPTFETGERIYPFLEIVNGPDIDTLGVLAFELISASGSVLQSWELFPEEILPSPQQTLYITPELRLRDVPPGTHTLRFAWEPDSGERFVREVELTIE